jgi:hypothetical protein
VHINQDVCLASTTLRRSVCSAIQTQRRPDIPVSVSSKAASNLMSVRTGQSRLTQSDLRVGVISHITPCSLVGRYRLLGCRPDHCVPHNPQDYKTCLHCCEDLTSPMIVLFRKAMYTTSPGDNRGLRSGNGMCSVRISAATPAIMNDRSFVIFLSLSRQSLGQCLD